MQPGFRTHVVGPCQGVRSCFLLVDGQVTPAAAGVSRGQGGAPDWTSDLDAGEDRRRIGRREGPGRSVNGVASQAPIRPPRTGRVRMTLEFGPGCSVS